MAQRRPAPAEVQGNRREILGASIAAYQAAVDGGDPVGAARELEAMRTVDLVVPDGKGGLKSGPDVAD